MASDVLAEAWLAGEERPHFYPGALNHPHPPCHHASAPGALLPPHLHQEGLGLTNWENSWETMSWTPSQHAWGTGLCKSEMK